MNLKLRDFYYNKLCASALLSPKARVLLLKWGGELLEKGVTIHPHCFIGNSNLSIGNGTFINYNVWFNTAGPIHIGKNCNIAFKVIFVTSSHEVGDAERRAGKATSEGIEVGDGTWIGANAMIMPGVKIGEGCIIAAGAVVTSDCQSNAVYAGVPARKIKDLA